MKVWKEGVHCVCSGTWCWCLGIDQGGRLIHETMRVGCRRSSSGQRYAVGAATPDLIIRPRTAHMFVFAEPRPSVHCAGARQKQR